MNEYKLVRRYPLEFESMVNEFAAKGWIPEPSSMGSSLYRGDTMLHILMVREEENTPNEI